MRDTNSAITSALNLDYDGDELNIWKPRSYLVKAELEYIISIKNCIISKYFDNSGLLWIGTDNGLDRYDPFKNQFKTINSFFCLFDFII